MNIFVAGFPRNFGKEELSSLFEKHGTVKSAKVIMHRDTGESRCFGFVEMAKEEEAKKAIESLHESMIEDRKLSVLKARENK